ncbi:MAG: protein BatD [Bacteroidales bacterium]|nr:protein BatD [Bacteroidales bacterium]
MKKFFLVFSFYLLVSIGCVSAQELRVRAPQNVALGQRFEVRYEVNDRCKDFRGPSFKGFSVLSGPNTSMQTGMTVINGQVTHSITSGFTYIIQADVEGSFEVGAASCTVEGKKITCPGFTIKVEKSRQQASGGSQQGQRGYSQPNAAQPAQSGNIDSKSLFARAAVSKTNPYQGEQVILTYKIYTQVSLSQYQIDKLPGNKGFWSEDLTRDGNVKTYEETVDGRRYMVAEIRRGAIFAQESGKLTIQPLDLDVLALVQRQRQRTGTLWDLFDDPFFNPTQAVEKHLRTNSLNINVKPLPQTPDGFTGAVGAFDVKGDVDTREVRANEAITYRLTVSGSGNLMLINAPQIKFSQVFEVYDPQVSDNLNRTANGVSGSRTFEWVLIPRAQGNYEIPAVDFQYFDPASGRYITKHVESIPVRVNRGDPNAMKHVTSSKNDVRLLNSDINYIQTRPSALVPKKDKYSIPVWFIVSFIVLVLVSFGASLFLRRRQARMQDVAGMRLSRATKQARKRLKKAAALLHAGDENRFYEEVYHALWGCLADKYNIPLTDLSSDTVRQILADRQIPEEQSSRIMETLQSLDMARFAPGNAADKMQAIYNQALDTIAYLS